MSSRHYVIHEYRHARARDLTVSHSTVGTDYRAVSSRRTCRPFSFLLLSRITEGRETRHVTRRARWPARRCSLCDGEEEKEDEKMRQPISRLDSYVSYVFLFFPVLFFFNYFPTRSRARGRKRETALRRPELHGAGRSIAA